MTVTAIARVLIGGIALYAIFNLWPIIAVQWQSGAACPVLGPLTACYLVGGCYALIALSALINPWRRRSLFFLGWVPVFGLALVGSMLEVWGQEACPRSASGIPLCFVSLAVALFLLFLVVISRERKPDGPANI